MMTKNLPNITRSPAHCMYIQNHVTEHVQIVFQQKPLTLHKMSEIKNVKPNNDVSLRFKLTKFHTKQLHE